MQILQGNGKGSFWYYVPPLYLLCMRGEWGNKDTVPLYAMRTL